MMRYFSITIMGFTMSLLLVAGFGLAAQAAITLSAQRHAPILLYETQSAPFDLVIEDLATGHRMALAGHPAVDRNAQWSPDSRTVVFESMRDTDGIDIYAVDVLADTLALLTAVGPDSPLRGEIYTRPAWTSDGERIIFIGEGLSPRPIFTLDVNSGIIREVSYDAPGVQQYLENIAPFRFVSPDGSRTVYYGTIPGRDVYGLYLETQDGDDRLLYQDDQRPLVAAYAPAWSPDSEKIALTAAVNGQMQILVVDVQNAAVEQITRDGGANPKWRP